MEDLDAVRLKMCLKLGFASMAHVHETVMHGHRMGAAYLLKKGLTLPVLHEFGYLDAILRRLGYSQETLNQLRTEEKPAKPPASTLFIPQANLADEPPLKANDTSAPVEAPVQRHFEHHAPKPHHGQRAWDSYAILEMIKEGRDAAGLRAEGVTLQHCRAMHLTLEQLRGLDFPLEELAQECTPKELLALGFTVANLKPYVRGADFYAAGIEAEAMRMAGFTIPDLVNFGYSDREICAAAFSRGDLMFNGISPMMRK